MARETADKKLERLLVMVPWITEQDGPTVSEVCRRFEMTEQELAADLEMLFMCGLYPFTPDTLIEADIVDGRVWIRYADTFERPPAFTSEEAISLVAAASAVLDLPQTQEGRQRELLESALQKLSIALGIDDEEVVDVELAPATQEVVDVIRKAVEECRQVQIDYYSYGRDSWKSRIIEPHRLFNAEGQWYVKARAVEVDERRTFRLDRMRQVSALETNFAPPSPSNEDPKVYEPRADDPSVTLLLESEASWVARQYPSESVTHSPDGTLSITLRVSESPWLERLMLRVGTHATVTAGNVNTVNVAQRILEKYEH